MRLWLLRHLKRKRLGTLPKKRKWDLMNLFFIGNGSNNTTMVNVRQDILLRRIMTQRWIWIGIIQTIWTFGVMVEKTLQWSKIIVTNPTF